jgi:HSP20 family molecular chaperone IbpA
VTGTELIIARYDKGILEITVPVAEAAPQGRRIDITHA